jgi:hypothetical protein
VVFKGRAFFSNRNVRVASEFVDTEVQLINFQRRKEVKELILHFVMRLFNLFLIHCILSQYLKLSCHIKLYKIRLS